MLEFFVRRFFRIAPAFYLAILFYICLGNRTVLLGAKWHRHWQVLLTIAFLHGWYVESINAVVPGGWSIAVEVMFHHTAVLYLMLGPSTAPHLFFIGFNCFGCIIANRPEESVA